MRATDLVSIFAPAFNAAAVEWMIVGGVASIVYGEPRLTQDLDIVASVQQTDVMHLVQQFPAPAFYCPTREVIAEEASRDAFGHFNLLHLETGARADVYLSGRDPLALRGLAQRKAVELAGMHVPIAPPEYVILHKLRFRLQGASERHLRDVRAMLRVLGDTVDLAALEQDATELGLTAAWRELERLRD
ncbi:MAG: hypothetical protein U0163_07805 [Gemmatimonadaceae bacterium]